MPANKSQVRFLFTLLAIVWGFLVATNALLAAWSNPTAVPPGSQPEPFLSTDNNSQTKTGALTIANDFYVIGSGLTGKVGIGTSTNETSSRLVVEPYTNASIDAGAGSIRTGWQAANDNDVINRAYLTSTLSASLDPIKYWTLSGGNLYASSTAYNVAIGTTTAGTAKLAVIGGNVGIGTTTPGAKLQIVGGNIRLDYNQKLEARNTANNIAPLIYLDGSNFTRMGEIINSNGFYIGTPSYAQISGSTAKIIAFISNSTERMRISANGNVGIGSNSPSSRLLVKGSGSDSTTSALNIQNSSGVSSLFVRNDGYIGIGTTSPTVSLYINGNAIADTPTDSKHLATKGYVDTAAQSLWINSGSFLYASSTSWRVGIGTTSPASALHIYPQNNIEGLRVVSSNYSPLVIVNSSSADLFRVNQYGDVTAVTSSATKMRSNQYCDASGANCFNPSGGWSADSYFVTTTPLTYNGSQGGYVAANLLCNAVVAGSHVCTTGEILDTINAGFASRIPIGAENAFWFSSGPPGYTVNANDCIGFTSNSAGDFGTIWTRTSSDNQGAGGLNSCNDSKKIACCK